MTRSPIRNWFANVTSFPIAVIFVVVVAVAGGASRSDELLQPVVRVGAILCATLLMVFAAQKRSASVRRPILFCALLLGWMILQLVPLPPALWTLLPGRALLATLAGMTGDVQAWRPISVAPDLTINSVMALLVPFCAMLVFSTLNNDQWSLLLKILLGVVAVSALFAIAQMTGRANALYFYRTTDVHGAVGLFANRNHQAMLLAFSVPMAVTVLSQVQRFRKRADLRAWIALAVCVALVPLVLATGSRAGLILFAAGIALSVPLHRRLSNDSIVSRSVHDDGRHVMLVRAAAVVALTGVAGGLTFIAARADTLSRLFSMNISDEQRFQLLKPIAEIAWKYLPTGAGFGTFDRVFRIDEPFSNLGPQYLNHAHNDWLELIIEGGIPAALIVVAFALWCAASARTSWSRARSDRASAYGRLGSVIVLLLGLASFADYPLRTPLMSTIFAIACCMIANGVEKRAPDRLGK
jgi:O-antigen ligase